MPVMAGAAAASTDAAELPGGSIELRLEVCPRLRPLECLLEWTVDSLAGGAGGCGGAAGARGG